MRSSCKLCSSSLLACSIASRPAFDSLASDIVDSYPFIFPIDQNFYKHGGLFGRNAPTPLCVDHQTLEAIRAPAEDGNRLAVLIGDMHIVNTCAPGQRIFAGLCGQ